MPQKSHPDPDPIARALADRRLWMMAAAASLAGCVTPPPPAPAPASPAPTPTGPVVTRPPAAAEPEPPMQMSSAATTPRAYRVDAATHIYNRNRHRIYKGTLPPLLYAIGVLEVHIDRQGRVTSLSWMRAPRHAPEVIKEIERTALEASPYPVPARMGRVTYTDTWLWDKSGHFQLDTLTEGQRGA
ncbi:hypothetical protein ACO2Q9_03510 [Variovorax sp. VNK109]|uniref:hypothetical protein n=1 Tax=Variovorax sp. VNK109 TaxID=3400919 RepID=UPI003C06E67C